MKTFISATDIEDLAAQGVRELTVDDDTVLTAVAREAATRLGVKLVAAGAAAPARPAPAAAAPAPVTGAKPRGCQHGPLTSGASATSAATPRTGSASSGGPVVDELIGAVKQLARK